MQQRAKAKGYLPILPSPLPNFMSGLPSGAFIKNPEVKAAKECSSCSSCIAEQSEEKAENLEANWLSVGTIA